MTSTLSSLFFIFISVVFYFKKSTKIIMISVISSLGVVFLYISSDLILERLSNVVFSDIDSLTLSEGSSVYWRFTAWSIYFSTMNFFDYIFGHGLGVSRFLLNPNSEVSVINKFSAPGTHNDYVQIIVDFGLVGLSLLIFFIKKLIKHLLFLSSFNRISYIFISFIFSLMIYMLMDNVIDSRFFFIIIFVLSSFIFNRRVV
nr:hypothetical protein BEI47_09745 [Aliivibrio fischeri]